MILLPAIDLMDGKVVRLKQGRADAVTVYSDDPASFARRWQDEGGDFLHIVDLDAAFTGERKNLSAIRAIAEALQIPCELGGGLRSRDAVALMLDAGVDRVVIGTRAAESLEFVAEIAAEFGSEHVAVGIDAKDGLVSVKGWTETTSLSAFDLARDCVKAGAGTIIYTDIATDGMMQGPNFAEMQRMMETVDAQVIASGGVTTLEDLIRLQALDGLHGAIIGRALYEGTIQLEQAVAALRAAAE